MLPVLRRNLRSARLNAGLTQQAFAEKAGVSYKYYQDLEAGRIEGLTLATIERLATAWRVEGWKVFHPDAVPTPVRARARSPMVRR
jgi:transcriptional regulator with XRE-family HTH domain